MSGLKYRPGLADSEDSAAFERWRDYFVPFFPELARELALPELQPTVGMHYLTVCLGRSKEHLVVPHTCYLSALADIIVDAFVISTARPVQMARSS